jgi:sphingolipid 4-desaturase/C4-monooxygenase
MKTPADFFTGILLKQLVSTPRGRAWLFSAIASVEGDQELNVFEALAEAAPDLKIQRLIQRHAADEERHAAQLEALAVKEGLPRFEVPKAANALHQLDRVLGVLSQPIRTAHDAMRAYVLLQVMEERATTQYGLYIEALRGVDDAAAAVLEGIADDEVRHIKYCQAVTAKLAPSPAVLAETLAHFRKVEAWAFTQTSHGTIQAILAVGALDQPAIVKAFWAVPTALIALLACRPNMDLRTFERVSVREPHQARRKTLLKRFPEIRALMGFDRRTIPVTLAVAVVQLGVAFFAAALPLWAVVALAYGVGAILSHWLGQTIHETSHNLAAKTRLANRALAWAANLPMALPIAETFHRYHVEHHAFLGVEGKDSDLPLPWEVRNIRGVWRKAAWLALYPVVYFARGAVYYAKQTSRAEVLNFLAIAAVNVVVWKLAGPMALLFLFLSTYFGHGPHPVAAHFLHEHYVYEAGQETYSYYGPFNLVTFNVGYHVEHHDFMNIPGWRLPEYRRLVSGAYDGFASHDSWTLLLLEFVARQDLGAWSRRVRSLEVHRAHAA